MFEQRSEAALGVRTGTQRNTGKKLKTRTQRKRRPGRTSKARKGQLGLAFSPRGGRRKGSGPKPAGDRAGVPHRPRTLLDPRCPVHVTLRMLPTVWNLRSRRSFRVIGSALRKGADRLGIRLCEFSIQGNHIHLLLEAAGSSSLARGVQGLSIRIAKGLNRLMGRRGRVFADRYHARILGTPTEVFRARTYILDNYRHHARGWGESIGPGWVDPYSSAGRGIPLPTARTWLLTEGVIRGRPGGITDEVRTRRKNRRLPRQPLLPALQNRGSGPHAPTEKAGWRQLRDGA